MMDKVIFQLVGDLQDIGHADVATGRGGFSLSFHS